jgi:hypothetical protein
MNLSQSGLPAVPPVEPPPPASRTAELGKAVAKRIPQAGRVRSALVFCASCSKEY